MCNEARCPTRSNNKEIAIQACDLFILLWSKNAPASEWVPQEIGIDHASQRNILPFVLEPGRRSPDSSRTYPTSLHIRISSKVSINFVKRL